MRDKLRFLILPLLLLLLTSCEQRNRDELLAKIKGLETPDAVKAAIGPADDIDSIGTSEIWKYETETKPVCFAVAGKTIVRLATCL